MPGLAPPHTDERELLYAYLDQQREALINTAYGLTEEQARLTPTRGSLSIGGLIKHVARTERAWVDDVLQREQRSSDADGYEVSFTLADDETIERAVADLRASGAELRDDLVVVSLDDPVPVPHDVPWFPDDIEAWSVRWVLLHLIEELARHAGHADIIREQIDGATTYELMAAAEGWPATEWLTPWQAGAAT